MAEEQGLARRHSPRGAHLPQATIDEALPMARALQELAAASTPQRIAQRLGVSPSGGRFRTRLGAANYYGFLRLNGDRRELTELGERALRDDEDGMRARRQAVLSTGFRALYTAFRGREVNEAVIQARLQDDFGVPPGASAQISRTLIDAGQQARLIVDGRFDAEAIEEALSQAPTRAEARQRRDSRLAPAPSGATPSPATARAAAAATTDPPAPPVHQQKVSPAVHIDIQIHIPATATNEQIDQIFASMSKHLYGRE